MLRGQQASFGKGIRSKMRITWVLISLHAMSIHRQAKKFPGGDLEDALMMVLSSFGISLAHQMPPEDNQYAPPKLTSLAYS